MSLVLASAYAGWTGSLPAEIVEQRLRQTLRAADSPPDQFVHSMIPTMFSESPPPEPVEEFRQIMMEMHPAGFRTMARSLAQADLRDTLAGIAVPTLLLYGDKDVRAPLTIAQELLTRIPASRFTVMPGVGHMSSVEAADRFNAEVRGFLRSVPG
jgi:pimeloyl-ACP methyl ester carboxylesterase